MGVEPNLAADVTGNVRPWWESPACLTLVVLATMIPLVYPPIPPLVDLFGIHLVPTWQVFLGMTPVYLAVTHAGRDVGWIDAVAVVVGLGAAALELAYSVTDPPLKALRRVIPPLRIGQVSLDLGFIILFIVVRILMGVVDGLR